MMKYGLKAISIFLSILFMSCSNTNSPVDDVKEPDQAQLINIDSVIKNPLLDKPEAQLITKQDVLDYIHTIIKGDSENVYQDYFSGIPVWVVIQWIPGEGNVVFYISIEYSIVINIEINNYNDDDEYDDDSTDCREVDFKVPFKVKIKFSEAYEVSKKHHDKGYMVKWKLFYHNDYHWVYMIKVKSSSGYYKLYVNAKNGEFIGKFKSKKED